MTERFDFLFVLGGVDAQGVSLAEAGVYGLSERTVDLGESERRQEYKPPTFLAVSTTSHLEKRWMAVYL